MKAPGSTWELHLKLANSSLGEGLYLTVLIGELKDMLHLSKIRDNVDHVGLLVQLVPWKDNISRRQGNFFLSVNNNWWTVLIAMVTKGVMEE